MHKIWGKLLKNQKIVNDVTLTLNSYDVDNLYDYLKEICYSLKVETPILLEKHLNQFAEYNLTKFTKDDFIDFINFDSLFLQYFED